MSDENPNTFCGQTFNDISDEMQWEWGTEIEICRDFIEQHHLGAELVMYARDVADAELGERVAEDEYKDWANAADWPDDIAELTLTPAQFKDAMAKAVMRYLIDRREP